MTPAISTFPDDVLWLSDAPRPKRWCAVDDTLTADAAFRLVSEGTALLWQGDFHNARQLLQALGRRMEHKGQRGSERGNHLARQVGAGETAPDPKSGAESFHRYRMGQAQKARTLGLILLPVEAGYRIPLRRAPDVAEACAQALGPMAAEAQQAPATPTSAVLPLRELQGLIGAYEWRRKGLPVAALDAAIHPHYGVFAPVRGEYVDLVAQAPLPKPCQRAFDIGTGTGVLAAVLAKRGVASVIATDASERALACARDNVAHLGFDASIQVVHANLFAQAAAPADLIVCNPPWVPGKAGSLLEQAVYDPDSRMLRGFLTGLRVHLTADGEGWLILSDLAEHLGLRTRAELEGWISAAGLRIAGHLDTRPQHRRVHDASDPLHAARAREVTSLWRLVHA